MSQIAIVLGNVGKEPKLTTLPSGDVVCNFTVASTERWNDKASGQKKEKTTWFNCSAFAGRAQTIAQFVKKGSMIQVTGTVSSRAWLNQAGEPQSAIELRLTDFSFAGSAGGANGGEGDSGSDAGYDDQAPAPTGTDDIPF